MAFAVRIDTARRLALALAASGLAAAPAHAQGKVNRCIGADGRVTLSQLPCPNDRGPTPAEVASAADDRRVAEIEKENRRAAGRADAQLQARFPDEAALRKAFVAEVDAVSAKIRLTTRRLDALVVERRPIDEERRFHVGKPLPPDLQRRFDSSESQFAAVAQILRELEAEIAAIAVKYERWRLRLAKLWAGAPAGSLGPLDTAAPQPR